MVMHFATHSPTLGRAAFVAATASVIGQVDMGDESSVWYGCVVRGDVGRISLGARTNIQDLSVIHVTHGTHDTHIAHDVSVGHRVILHGCTVQHHVLVGMGAILMDGVNVGPYSLIGAGALLTPGTQVPERSLVIGSPGRVVRPIRDSEIEIIDRTAALYVKLAQQHSRGAGPLPE